MIIVKYRKIFFVLSLIMVTLSLYSIFAYGLNLGIDFRGGTLTEVYYEVERPSKDDIEQWIGDLDLGGFSVRQSGDKSYIIRTRELSIEDRARVEMSLGLSDSPLTIERSNTIGPVAGAELKNKAILAVIVVVFMIVLFVTFAFRKVSKPVASWRYGLATIIALFHDIIIPVGVFVFLGRLYGLEIDLLFVSGLLAILGYSVHDTIVVFDRVRENLRVNEEEKVYENFETTIGKSVTQTLARSINTSLTLLIVLITLYFIGSTATRDFSLLLIIGVIAGTYSSIFLASPLLVTFYKLSKSK
jgi:preprotein translocase subunit SecF